MEGINKELFDLINSEIASLNIDSEILEKFLKLDVNKYKKRQKLALEISGKILEPHSKAHIPKHGITLASIERNLKDLQPYQRDHICHSLLTFLLGFVVIKKLDLNKNDFLFQWKLAALLHDFGYPLEITDNINKDFFVEYNQNLLNNKSFEFEPKSGIYLSDYLSLYTTSIFKKRNTIKIIKKRLKDWKINIDTDAIFLKMINGHKFDEGTERTDHGVASAILVMKAIDILYEKNNPKQLNTNSVSGWRFSNMKNQITNACSAIFIHNLNLNGIKYDFKSAILASLLKLCDELQDWGRPISNKPKGYSPNDYSFKFKNRKFIFYVVEKREQKIKQGIKNIINFPLDIRTLK